MGGQQAEQHSPRLRLGRERKVRDRPLLQRDRDLLNSDFRQADIVSLAPDLVGMTLPELELFISEFGKERYRAVQIMKWIHQGLADSFDVMTNLSKKLREELSAKARI